METNSDSDGRRKGASERKPHRMKQSRGEDWSWLSPSLSPSEAMYPLSSFGWARLRAIWPVAITVQIGHRPSELDWVGEKRGSREMARGDLVATFSGPEWGQRMLSSRAVIIYRTVSATRRLLMNESWPCICAILGASKITGTNANDPYRFRCLMARPIRGL